jgi:hypothetical protein
MDEKSAEFAMTDFARDLAQRQEKDLERQK